MLFLRVMCDNGGLWKVVGRPLAIKRVRVRELKERNVRFQAFRKLSHRALRLSTEKQFEGEQGGPTGIQLSDVHPRSKRYDRIAGAWGSRHRKHRIGR